MNITCIGKVSSNAAQDKGLRYQSQQPLLRQPGIGKATGQDKGEPRFLPDRPRYNLVSFLKKSCIRQAPFWHYGGEGQKEGCECRVGRSTASSTFCTEPSRRARAKTTVSYCAASSPRAMGRRSQGWCAGTARWC